MDLPGAMRRAVTAARSAPACLFGLALLLLVPTGASGQAAPDDCDPAVAARDPACAIQIPREPPPLDSGPPFGPGPDLGTMPGGQAEAPTREDARPEPGGGSDLLPAEERGLERRRRDQPADPGR